MRILFCTACVICSLCKIYKCIFFQFFCWGPFQEHISCFPDGTRDQGFSPGGHKRLLFLIVGGLINKSGINGAGALVVDGLPVERLEHWVTGVQRLPVTVLKQQTVAGKVTQRCCSS